MGVTGALSATGAIGSAGSAANGAGLLSTIGTAIKNNPAGMLSLAGGTVSAVGSLTKGFQENSIAQQNAQIYEAQAKNIAAAQQITAEQYRTKQNVLRGQATATAARNGLKISGSTANSISQSIMQLQMDNSYEQYNLQVEKYKARMEADIQRQKGRNAIGKGFVDATATALEAGSNYYSKYWKGSNNNNQNGIKVSGGFDAPFA